MNETVFAVLVFVGLALVYLIIGSVISGFMYRGDYEPTVVMFWSLCIPASVLYVIFTAAVEIGDIIRDKFDKWWWKIHEE